MNKEMTERLKTAAEYQRKAILALLPESTAGHLNVIGKELKLMLAETATGCIKKAASPEGKKGTADGGVKKVDIG